VEEFRRDPKSVHAPRSGPEIKDGRSSAKDGTPERFRCGKFQKEVHKPDLHLMTAGAEEEFPFRFILHKEKDNRMP